MGERGAVANPRLLAASGGMAAAMGVALAAYAAHAGGGPGQASLSMAAVFLLCHGIALAALARDARSRLHRGALLAILAGSVLFAGSLLLAHLAAVPARLAPAGGLLMIGGWLGHVVATMRG